MSILTLQAIQDTFISQSNPNTNYGSSTSLFSGKFSSAPSNYRSLLKFDISSITASADIQSAILKLYIHRNDDPSISKPTSIYNLLAEFNESTVTYSNQPSYASAPSSTLNITSQLNTFLQWDITYLVKDWQQGIITNYGLIIINFESMPSLVGFYSRKFSTITQHPVLTIEYSEDDSIIQYPPQNVTSCDDWNYTTSIPLKNRIGTFGVVNTGVTNNAYVTLQVSTDGITWIDDHPPYLSLYEFAPGDDTILTSNGYMFFVRAAYKSVASGQPAHLTVYVTTKKQ